MKLAYALALALPLTVQPPNFSGKWADAATKLTVQVRQDTRTLTFEMFHDGQSGGETTLDLDDKPHADGRWTTRTAWDGAKLVTTTESNAAGNGPKTVRQVWSVKGDTLSIEMTQLAADGTVIRKLTSTFVRSSP